MRALAAAPAQLPEHARHRLQAECAAELLAYLDVRLEVRGREHVPAVPHLIVALHESIVDALCLMQLGLPLRCAARREIFAWSLVGPAIGNMGHAPLDPERPQIAYRQLLRAAHAAFGAGTSFCVFPQGTVLGIETAFQRGAFRVAQVLDVPILPVVLTGAHRVWEHPFSPCLRFGERVSLSVLPPIGRAQVRSSNYHALCAQVEREMKALALSGAVCAPRRYVPERDGFWDGYAFEIDPVFAQLRERLAARRASVRAAGASG
jgi:1-acyl-sn-glycerol-3-phosphate acyltransferase